MMIFKQIYLLLYVFSFQTFANEYATKDFTVNINSFSYHSSKTFQSQDYNQKFNNNFFSFGFRIGPKEHLKIGTLTNSFGDQCFLIGIKKHLYKFNPRFFFEGFYAYTGEFILDVFKDCTSNGYYLKIKESTGFPGIPYIFHGFEYFFSPHMSIEFGVLLPGISIATIQINF